MPSCPWGSPKTSLAQESVQTLWQHQPRGAKGRWSPVCHLTPGCPPTSLPHVPPSRPGRCPWRGQRGRPGNTVPADVEQIGFPMVIGPVQSGDTDLFVQGEQGRARRGGWGHQGGLGRAPRGAGSTLGCADTAGGSLCLGVPTGPPVHSAYLQRRSSPCWCGTRWGHRSPQPMCHQQHPSMSHVEGVPKTPQPHFCRGRGSPLRCAHACASTRTQHTHGGVIVLPALGSCW